MPSWGAWIVAAGVVLASQAAAAKPPSLGRQSAPLSAAERRALSSGESVGRPLRFARVGARRYVGGIAYQVVRAPPAFVLSTLADVDALPQALPRTERASLVSAGGKSARIELTQGKRPFLATYTIYAEQSEEGDTIRFWLDRARPHDVRDVWGYFRVTPFGAEHSLVTVAVAVDLGPGLARMLFEERVERTILRTPAQIRAFVEPRAEARRAKP